MIRVAGIVRKSPTNKGVEENIQIQIDAINNWCDNRFGKNNYIITFFIDKNVSGDDPNRPELIKHFNNISDYDYAVAHVVDRFVRHPRGSVWFLDYYTTDEGRNSHNGCKLYFVEGMSNLYHEDYTLNYDMFTMFSIFCATAFKELNDIRRRTKQGRDRLTPEERANKFKGRKKGSITKETIELKKKITNLREKGNGISTIANKLNLTKDKVKYIIYKVNL